MTLRKLERKVLVFIVLLTAFIALTQWRAAGRERQAAEDYPPLGQLVTVNGTVVHVQVTGTGPDLVLIHGASGNVRDFTYGFVDRLKDRYRVIVMDRPGLGWTQRLPGMVGAWNSASESPQQQADLLQAAADKLGIVRPMVLGHSYGGSVALAWALSRPDDTAALVLVSGVTNPWPGNLGALYTITGSSLGGAVVVPLITAFAPERVVKNTINAIFAPQNAPEGYADHVGPALTLRRPSLRANAQQVNALRPHVVEIAKSYETLGLPIELVHGTADTIVPSRIHSETFVRQAPNARLTLLEGIGHMPHHAVPEGVISAIDRAAARAGLR